MMPKSLSPRYYFSLVLLLLLFLSGNSLYATQGAFYSFESGGGITVDDDSLNNNNGAFPGTMTYTAGKYGSGVVVNSVNDTISIPDSPSLRLGKNHTISAWVKLSSRSPDWVRVVGKGSSGNRNYGLWIKKNGDILYQCYSRSGANINFYGNYIVPLNTWTHITLTYDGTKAKIYVNGSLNKEVTINDPIPDGDAVYLEAENASLNAFSVNNDNSASEAQYILPPSGNSIGSPGSARATYTVNLNAGTYKLWGRVIAPNVNDDSFWVQVNNGSWTRWNGIAKSSDWLWDEVHDKVNQVKTYTLSAGTHTIRFANREDGTKLDQVYITSLGDTPSSQVFSYSSDPMTIGYAGYHTYLRGDVDNVGIFKKTLSAAEVSTLHAGHYQSLFGISSSSASLPKGIARKYYTVDQPNYDRVPWDRIPNFAAMQANNSENAQTIAISAASPGNNFGYSFNGFITIDQPGTYTFYTTSDDGSKLYINDETIVDNDGLHPMIEKNGVVALEAGVHKIRVDYFERTGGEGLDVKYSGPGVSKRAIPADKLTLLKPVLQQGERIYSLGKEYYIEIKNGSFEITHIVDNNWHFLDWAAPVSGATELCLDINKGLVLRNANGDEIWSTGLDTEFPNQSGYDFELTDEGELRVVLGGIPYWSTRDLSDLSYFTEHINDFYGDLDALNMTLDVFFQHTDFNLVTTSPDWDTVGEIYTEQLFSGGYVGFTLKDLDNLMQEIESFPGDSWTRSELAEFLGLEAFSLSRQKGVPDAIYGDELLASLAKPLASSKVWEMISDGDEITLMAMRSIRNDLIRDQVRPETEPTVKRYLDVIANNYDSIAYTSESRTATITISADNSYRLYVNGVQIGTGGTWTSAQVYTVSLNAGPNTIAVDARDSGGQASLIASITIDGHTYNTGSDWKVKKHHSGFPSQWKEFNFNDSSWANAREYGSYGVAPWNYSAYNIDDSTTAKWIWSDDNLYDNHVYFRKKIVLSQNDGLISRSELNRYWKEQGEFALNGGNQSYILERAAAGAKIERDERLWNYISSASKTGLNKFDDKISPADIYAAQQDQHWAETYENFVFQNSTAHGSQLRNRINTLRGLVGAENLPEILRVLTVLWKIDSLGRDIQVNQINNEMNNLNPNAERQRWALGYMRRNPAVLDWASPNNGKLYNSWDGQYDTRSMKYFITEPMYAQIGKVINFLNSVDYEIGTPEFYGYYHRALLLMYFPIIANINGDQGLITKSELRQFLAQNVDCSKNLADAVQIALSDAQFASLDTGTDLFEAANDANGKIGQGDISSVASRYSVVPDDFASQTYLTTLIRMAKNDSILGSHVPTAYRREAADTLMAIEGSTIISTGNYKTNIHEVWENPGAYHHFFHPGRAVEYFNEEVFGETTQAFDNEIRKHYLMEIKRMLSRDSRYRKELLPMMKNQLNASYYSNKPMKEALEGMASAIQMVKLLGNDVEIFEANEKYTTQVAKLIKNELDDINLTDSDFRTAIREAYKKTHSMIGGANAEPLSNAEHDFMYDAVSLLKNVGMTPKNIAKFYSGPKDFAKAEKKRLGAAAFANKYPNYNSWLSVAESDSFKRSYDAGYLHFAGATLTGGFLIYKGIKDGGYSEMNTIQKSDFIVACLSVGVDTADGLSKLWISKNNWEGVKPDTISKAAHRRFQLARYYLDGSELGQEIRNVFSNEGEFKNYIKTFKKNQLTAFIKAAGTLVEAYDFLQNAKRLFGDSTYNDDWLVGAENGIRFAYSAASLVGVGAELATAGLQLGVLAANGKVAAGTLTRSLLTKGAGVIVSAAGSVLVGLAIEAVIMTVKAIVFAIRKHSFYRDIRENANAVFANTITNWDTGSGNDFPSPSSWQATHPAFTDTDRNRYLNFKFGLQPF